MYHLTKTRFSFGKTPVDPEDRYNLNIKPRQMSMRIACHTSSDDAESDKTIEKG